MTSKTQRPASLENTLLDAANRLHSASIHLLRAVRSGDRASGIGPAQLSALSVLVFGGDRSLSELADAEQVRPPTMSRIVASLERTGLARRRKTSDRRQISLAATPKGIRLLRQAQKRRIEVLANALSSLPPEDIQRISQLAELAERAIRSM
jgi:DNA-binding MarR family transcriptional regulator